MHTGGLRVRVERPLSRILMEEGFHRINYEEGVFYLAGMYPLLELLR